MRTATLSVAVLLGLAAPALAQDAAASYEAVVKDMIAATDRLTGVLAAIKDSASAEAARPELKKAAAEFVAVRKLAATLPQPDQKERDRIVKEYQKKLSQAVERFLEERARVGRVPGGRDALQELAALDPASRPAPKAKKKD